MLPVVNEEFLCLLVWHARTEREEAVGQHRCFIVGTCIKLRVERNLRASKLMVEEPDKVGVLGVWVFGPLSKKCGSHS